MVSPSRGSSSQTSNRVQVITTPGLKWIDIADPGTSETASLGQEYGFHPLDLQDCLSGKVTKVEDHGDHVFLLLHFPVKDDRGLIVPNRISMFLGKDYLVTLHQADSRSISEIFESCRDDEQKRASLMKSSAYLAYLLVDGLVGTIAAILDEIQGTLDGIEAVVFDEKKSQAVPINHARRRMAALARIAFPLRLYLPDLSKAQKFSKDDLAIYFSDLNHKIGLASRTIDEVREMLEIYKDTDYVISSNRTNSVLSLLTIFFTLTIPGALVAAIYGMNIPLPGALTPGPLHFAGVYSSFLVIGILMIIPALIMIAYFRRAGWF